jgi:carnitine-CoA ligase
MMRSNHVQPPADDDCVLGAALQRRAREIPDKMFIRFESGATWTYAQTLDTSLAAAGALHSLGVKPGDAVMVWLPNGMEMVRCWFALSLLGAIFVPINTAYRGRILEHVVDNAAARLAIVHAELLPRLAEIASGSLEQIVVVGNAGDSEVRVGSCVVHRDTQTLAGPPIDVTDLPQLRPWDLHAIVYTSGTTGASKGVLTSYLHLASMALGGREMITADDHRLVALPLFHSGGLQAVLGTLLKGGSLSLLDAFATNTFWRTVRDTGATSVTLLGAMIGFLMKAPVEPGEREHKLRSAFLVPYPADGPAFSARFGVATYTNYNSTETSNPLVSECNPVKAGLCGRPRPGVQARIVDEHDFDVPEGVVGELLLRTDLPRAMSHGYHRDPEATAAAWRNGWFHTGELFRRDADGDFFFVDRKKDSIRRRGENISSTEVEREILAHPAVQEAAVLGVPSEFGEDDVLAVVACRSGAVLDPADLLAFLQPRVAHFMIPRYVRVVAALPRTSTHKVQKYLLRSEGLPVGTWDRERAGIRIQRDRLRAT